MFTCICLAAGLSTRFGSPKALAQINHEPAITFIQKKFLSTSCDELIIVLGAHADQIKAHVLNHKRIRIVYNKDYSLGQTSSVQAGLYDVSSETSGALLWPVDCPFIDASTVDVMLKSFHKQPALISIPTLDGKRGHPPLLSFPLFDDIRSLSTDQGINTLFDAHKEEILYVPVNDPGTRLTFNTPQELDAILRKQ